MRPDHRSSKPSYTLSRRQIWASFWFAWGVNAFILISAVVYHSAEAVQLAPVITPSTFLLIAAMLGVHRFSGAADYRAAAILASNSPEAGEVQ
ncbi:NAD(P)+ transhydrogenase beta chain [Rhizobium leguminosarum]|uniref:NAD(P)+ transhydrogenase beta chain n=1 Tax=Rhizobium leguminosarum TaxID=384 RepID=UPI003F9C4832